MSNTFLKAQPIWLKDLEREMNITCGFKTILSFEEKDIVVFRIAASSIYRFFINGEFTGYGPARGPHGYYRVDQWELSDKLGKGENILTVEVTGYNINSYYLLDQPAFLQAEILVNNQVIASTSGDGKDFYPGRLKERVQRVQRHGFQRTFTEAYRCRQDFDSWRKIKNVNLESCEIAAVEEKKLIGRNLPYPSFESWFAKSTVDWGKVERDHKPGKFWTDRSLTDIGDKFKGFREDELDVYLTREIGQMKTTSQKHEKTVKEYQPMAFESNTYRTCDFGINKTGFIEVALLCKEEVTVYLLFDEILKNNDVDYLRMGSVNAVKYELKAGEYRLITIEPYTMRYLKILTLGGSGILQDIRIREYKAAVAITARLETENQKHIKIFDAAVETFLQNCPDIYMDCPSRERAGWLCDSYFIGKTEYCLTGKTDIERNFLENYLLPEKFEFLPDGMLPMCYPADHNDGNFIPNWALWLVIELKDYYERSHDREMIDAFKDKVYRLFEYFEAFRNEYGLLERLDAWVFIEWSKANELVQDVNFPSNMMYAAALKAAGQLYGDETFISQSEQLQKTIRRMSFDGSFFVDNAVRKNGFLLLSGERTEVCQYYAFFCETAGPETHKELWNKLVGEFGPQRKKTQAYPEIYPANAFIGNYLRLDILLRHGLKMQLLEEIDGFFYYQAVETGTLWEQDISISSCNHGFASYAANLLLEAERER